MKLEFDVKVTEKDLYSFNIEQAYKGSQGVISLLFAVLLAVWKNVLFPWPMQPPAPPARAVRRKDLLSPS